MSLRKNCKKVTSFFAFFEHLFKFEGFWCQVDYSDNREVNLIFYISFAVFFINNSFVFCASNFGQTKYFPKDFIFGAGSASYQVEGAWNVSGKGLSIWDYATHKTPQVIADRSNGDVAANSYELYKEDIKALKTIGLNYYRFSISWPRILPNGDLSKINPLGLAHYDNLINELLANGILPLVTIFHWDLPQKLQEIGGMLNPIIVDHFVNYARILFERYGDRVKLWSTINEPIAVCQFGYGTAMEAPFVNSSGVGDYICGRNALLAHAKIYHLYHDRFNQDKVGKIGLVFPTLFYYPKDPNNAEDIKAAAKTFEFVFGWFAHPIFSKDGGYPAIMVDAVRENSRKEKLSASRLPSFSNSERRLIQGTSDYLFLNYYTSALVTFANESESLNFPTPSIAKDLNTVSSVDPAWPASALPSFYSVPKGLRDLLNWIRKVYNNPTVIITENGWADLGGLNDVGRQTFLKDHLQAVLDAILEDGCRVHGHFTWALIDDFEWTSGYTPKFGLYAVDFGSPNKTRTAKNSSKFLRNVIVSGKIPN